MNGSLIKFAATCTMTDKLSTLPFHSQRTARGGVPIVQIEKSASEELSLSTTNRLELKSPDAHEILGIDCPMPPVSLSWVMAATSFHMS